MMLTTRPNRVIESLREVGVHRLALEPFGECIGDERFAELRESLSRAAEELAERVVVTVNSTAAGGGVAEMLPRLLGYERACGIDARWYVLDASESFFRITKRLHHRLHGARGDDGALGPQERDLYEAVIDSGVNAVTRVVRAGDIVHLHDPQVLGLAPALAAAGARVIWQLHIGADRQNEVTEEAWSFLEPYFDGVDTFVFSRSAYAPPGLDGRDVRVIAPSIDPFSVKNMPMDDPVSVLACIGVIDGTPPSRAVPFRREDGSVGRIDGRASVITDGLPPATDQIVVQVSRWDPLKGMVELLDVAPDLDLEAHSAHLMLVGPDVDQVDDDPEGSELFAMCESRWSSLPAQVRGRVHLVCLPMDDPEENAAMVNAIQRHSAVVVQNSRAEGFGLTVTEAMWKGRPVVATGVGGICDQIEHGAHGVLVSPDDPRACAEAIRALVSDHEVPDRLGRAARTRVSERYLDDRHLVDRANLYRDSTGASA